MNPERPGRKDELGPDALLVQIQEPFVRIVRSRRADGLHERHRIAADHFAVHVDDLAFVADSVTGPRSRIAPEAARCQRSTGSRTCESAEFTR